MTEVLGIVKEGKLIPEELWIKLVSSIENNFDALETNLQRAKRELAAKIEEAIKRRTQTADKFGILFSGGVDSTLIAFVAKKLGCRFTCYTVGLENSDDISWAKGIAQEYSLNHKFHTLSTEELAAVIKSVVKILNDADVTKVSVGSVLYAGAKLALADNLTLLFGGLGSEEIFAGYKRHEDAFTGNNFEALHRECWNGLKNMWQRDLVRDFTISKTLNVRLMAPFLDKDVIKYAMTIHPMHKIDFHDKKIILRHVAEFVGLKKGFAWRKKQAAQYGSDFIKGIDKLVARNGFKYKKEYLESLLR